MRRFIMKSTVVKSLILMLMIAALAALIIIPPSISAKTVLPGKKTHVGDLDACACPIVENSDCACIIKPPVD